MRRVLWAIAFAGVAAGMPAVGFGQQDKDVRLAGCLVRAEGGQGFLMTNLPGEAVWQQSADARVMPGPVGTSGTVSTIFYWLDERDGLDDHVGHVIEIEGRLDDELRDGELRLERKDGWTEIEVRSADGTLKAQVPRSLLVLPAEGDRETRIDVLVRRVDPRRVRMLAPVCGR
jgi:hypothetical protein